MKTIARLLLLFSALLSLSAQAIDPVKVDFNLFDRNERETNEPGYTSWIVPAGKSHTLQVNGLTITLTSKGDGQLNTFWYKAGIENARLVSDGVFVSGLPAESEHAIIEMRIQGLPAGQHTLLTYHNCADDPKTNTFAPIDIYLNGKQVKRALSPTVRAATNREAAKYYLSFPVQANEAVVLEWKRTTGVQVSNKALVLNGFEIDAPNVDDQAGKPFPADRDEHVDTGNGSIALTWQAAPTAVSHDIYFGKDKESVAKAHRQSPEYKGNQQATTYSLADLYSMDTYYWRIDEITAQDQTTPGNVWYFRPRQLAFPGAEGYGRFARGGRGGIVVQVTNLNDDGPGSLRDAIQNPVYANFPRTIVFDVSGVIRLQRGLSVNQPYITIAGQTAPGKGICITGVPFGMGGSHDIVFQHLRLRVAAEATTDGMGQSGADHSIIDHASISWSKDEATSSRNGRNITFQHSLISEPLNRAGHKNYRPGSSHGYAGSIGGDIGSYHHNLLAHSYGRNWSLAGGLDGNGYYKGKIDIFNNVIYNWGTRTTDGGAHQVNFVGNYYKPGVETTQFYALNAQWDGFPGTQQYYCSGNIVEGKFEDLSDPLNACRSDAANPNPWSEQPFFPSYAEVHTAKDAYKQVLSDAGATQPAWDEHDRRIVRETLDGTWTYRGSYNAPNGTRGVIDHPDDVGGLEDYGSASRPADYDSDRDGLPDWWEKYVSHTPPASPAADFSDANADPDRDGFTHMDDFLHWMGNPHHYTTDNALTLDLKSLTSGYTDRPVYTLVATDNANAILQKDGTVRISPLEPLRLTSFTFAVTDREGSRMTRTVGLFFAPFF
jgi:hypothetical protein